LDQFEWLALHDLPGYGHKGPRQEVQHTHAEAAVDGLQAFFHRLVRINAASVSFQVCRMLRGTPLCGGPIKEIPADYGTYWVNAAGSLLAIQKRTRPLQAIVLQVSRSDSGIIGLQGPWVSPQFCSEEVLECHHVLRRLFIERRNVIPVSHIAIDRERL